MLRLTNLKVSLNKLRDPQQEQLFLRQVILEELPLQPEELLGYRIVRKSVDARHKTEIFLVYTLDLEVRNEDGLLARTTMDGARKNGAWQLQKAPFREVNLLLPGKEKMEGRPVIVGFGPAGLFAGLTLAKHGYRPLILERGEAVEERVKKVEQFWSNGQLDPESNAQFGEGGAGAFSDGKLTTLINDPRSRMVLTALVEAGAPEEILYLNKPHVGTDLLRRVIKELREEIIAQGGEVRFRTKVTDLVIVRGKVTGLILNETEELACTTVLLGIGHSARETFAMLWERGVAFSPKPFSIGVRIEHPQELIDRAQYGKFAGHPALGAADYKLAYHSPSGRSAYTFCMCPGGYVIAAASEAGGITINGMSEHARNGRNANAALLVGVTPADFGSPHPLAGIEFQRRWEREAFRLAGENYYAPVQLVGDFLADRPSRQLGKVTPTYRPGVTLAPLKACLPAYVVDTLREALRAFDRKLKGFAAPDSVLTGVETRSSSPVRINRNLEHQSNIEGLYPIGEGAGYAGGIISAAVDGIKTAEQIIAKFAPP